MNNTEKMGNQSSLALEFSVKFFRMIFPAGVLAISACSVNNPVSNNSNPPGAMGGVMPSGSMRSPSNDRREGVVASGWVKTEQDRLSTFAADSDTGSYTLARKQINTSNCAE